MKKTNKLAIINKDKTILEVRPMKKIKKYHYFNKNFKNIKEDFKRLNSQLKEFKCKQTNLKVLKLKYLQFFNKIKDLRNSLIKIWKFP
jgi:hypothetical protein